MPLLAAQPDLCWRHRVRPLMLDSRSQRSQVSMHLFSRLSAGSGLCMTALILVACTSRLAQVVLCRLVPFSAAAAASDAVMCRLS